MTGRAEQRPAESVILSAVFDPGKYTIRRDNHGESLSSWQARAVMLALHDEGYVVEKHSKVYLTIPVPWRRRRAAI